MGATILVAGLFISIYLVKRQTSIKSFAYEQRPSSEASLDDEYEPPALVFAKLNSEIGFQIDTADPEKIPTRAMFNSLSPAWIRFVYRVDKGVPSCNPNIPYVPADQSPSTRCIPDDVKVLLVFNNESVEGAPIGSENVKVWKDYINNSYLPAIDDLFARQYKFNALELWNEEDICPSDEFCPGIPAQAYAYLLKQASAKIKQKSGVQIIMGGMNSGTLDYINEMLSVDKNVFQNIDAIGLHPYGTSPDGWCKSKSDKSCVAALTYGDLGKEVQKFSKATGKPVWVTELGFGVKSDAKSEGWQTEYLQRAFKTLSDNNVPMVIWYSYTDRMQGGVNDPGFGLIKANSVIKGAGTQFQSYSRK